MDDTVKILNKLIETSEDGLKGFNEASERATEPQLKQVFADRAQSCSQSVRELQTLVAPWAVSPRSPVASPAPRIAAGSR